MAAAHLGRDQPVRAIIPAQRAVRAGDIPAHRLLARALVTTGRSADALKVIRKARKVVPNKETFRRLLVETLIADGQLDLAADTADELLIDLQSTSARSLHAWALSRANRVESAVAMAAEAAAVASDVGMIQAQCASIFWKGKRKEDFQRANKMARALLPASPRQEMQRALWYAEQGHKERAIRRLEALRGAYTTSGQVAAQLGFLYSEQAAWPDAARHLSAALKLKPYVSDKSVSGVTLMEPGDNVKESKRRAEHIEIANKLGDAYLKIGQPGKAALAWQEGVARTLKPTASAYIGIAQAWRSAGNIDRMGQAAQMATNLEPTNAEAHLLLAQAYDASRNLEWAIRHAQKSWELNPDKTETVVFLGELLESRGEKRVARELYRDALRRHPSDARIYAAFERVGGTRK
jgi:tetratricopeptide (TPR) repeat protein